MSPAVQPVLGLSPRVRGNRALCRNRHSPVGSIPACAGEPAAMAFAIAHLAVYPRVCGGTAGRATVPMPRSGLSPRVRGNRA